MATSSGKEKFLSYNTLTVLLIAMKNCSVTVETKNESSIHGQLQEADGFGNIWLNNATVTHFNGHSVNLKEVYVKASSVRYVHIPDHVDPIKLITRQLNKSNQPRNSGRVRKK